MEPRLHKTATRRCIWMQSGVVKKKECRENYNCPGCRFDRIMQHTADQNRKLKQAGKHIRGQRGNIAPWQERLRALPLNKRPCIHHLKGRIDFKACLQEYNCGNCEFDQFFDDQYSVHAVVCPVDFLEIKGIRIPRGYYFHPGHTWVKVEESDEVRVGIDDFALRLLGPLDRVISPLLGKTVEQGRAEIGAVRGDQRAGLLSPVDGVVLAMNSRLREQGTLANQSPYYDGWVMRVKSRHLRENLKKLMIHEETEAYIENEVERLQVIIEEAEPMATDGGYPGYDIYGSLPALGWDRLVGDFLK